MEAIRTRDASPWLPLESARPLQAWTGQQLDALAAALGRALADWRAAWGLAGDAPALRCEAATSEAALRSGWVPLAEGVAGAWLHVPADAGARLQRDLFGDAGGALAATVAQECAHDAGQRLAAVLRLPPEPAAELQPPPGTGLPWSGAVQAELAGTPGWSLLLGAAAMRAWCAQRGLRAQDTPARAAPEPLCSAAEALGARTLPLDVRLAGCELDLGTLQGLQIGDVVRLSHRLDAPARLTDAGGKTLFDGFLVAQKGRKALELVPPQPPTH